MLELFLRWASLVRHHLAAAGFWADAVDPRTGRALFGSAGSQWSEVTAARTLLRYNSRDAGACPVLVHPVHGAPPRHTLAAVNQHVPAAFCLSLVCTWDFYYSDAEGVRHSGTACYPATLFTTAPQHALREAMSAASTPRSLAPAVDGAAMQRAPALLSITDLSCDTVLGLPIVRGLSLSIPVAAALLVEGPSASGKSTLLRLLAGLHPCRAGHFALPPPDQVRTLACGKAPSRIKC